MASSGRNSNNSQVNRDDHNEQIYIPSATAFAFTAFVFLFSFAIVVIACFEITESSFWRKTPGLLQRALDSHSHR
jgi:hypothetical protein